MRGISWLLPHGASTFVGEIDWLYYLILGVTGTASCLMRNAGMKNE